MELTKGSWVLSMLCLGTLCLSLQVIHGAPWSNGPAGNATTNSTAECGAPPYATHDWIADHALALLPNEEKAWIVPHQTMYLMGTEAPDNRNIPSDCGAPHNGYDDQR